MEMKKEAWAVLSFKEYESQINPNPRYQRPSVWSTAQKQELIDSILRKIDIPKIYLREIHGSKYQYEIIDGQQRMRTIWEFLKDGFDLPQDDSEVLPIGGQIFELAGKTYSQLDHTVKMERVHKYNLDVVIVYKASEDEIADLFHRLNNGTPLVPAEVRNAMPGEVTPFVRGLAEHPFFSTVGFQNRRFAHHQIAAQMLLLALHGGITDISDKKLTQMYYEYSKAVPAAKQELIKKALKTLQSMFPAKSRLLNRAQTINLFILVLHLLGQNKIPNQSIARIRDWYVNSEPNRQKKDEYKLYMKSAANSHKSLLGRFQMLLLDLQQGLSDLELVELDPLRIFSDQQKSEMYARYKGVCQKCAKQLDEYGWHADHIVPWSKGGRTVLENGQVLCTRCNLSKGAQLW
jgi:hypothetical protein